MKLKTLHTKNQLSFANKNVEKRLWQVHMGNTCTTGVKCHLLISLYMQLTII
jgi:hypothetical protein